jgi:hypothetical protein
MGFVRAKSRRLALFEQNPQSASRATSQSSAILRHPRDLQPAFPRTDTKIEHPKILRHRPHLSAPSLPAHRLASFVQNLRTVGASHRGDVPDLRHQSRTSLRPTARNPFYPNDAIPNSHTNRASGILRHRPDFAAPYGHEAAGTLLLQPTTCDLRSFASPPTPAPLQAKRSSGATRSSRIFASPLRVIFRRRTTRNPFYPNEPNPKFGHQPEYPQFCVTNTHQPPSPTKLWDIAIGLTS